MSTFGKLHGQQSHIKGMEKLLRTKYRKDDEFSKTVDQFLACGLDLVDMKRAAAVAMFVAEFNKVNSVYEEVKQTKVKDAYLKKYTSVNDFFAEPKDKS